MTNQKLISKNTGTRRLPQELEPLDYFDSFFFRPVVPFSWQRFPGEDLPAIPAVEMIEKDDKYVVKAELPGIKEDDIEVVVKDGNLAIKGEKKYENDVKEEDYHYRETSYGSFYRTLSLPSNISEGKIAARYEDGVLEIDLPKEAETKTKKIAISKKKDKTGKK